MRADYYVYVHRRADSGTIFYVGKGSGDRAWDDRKSDHNQFWNRIVAKYGRTVEIVMDLMTEQQAHHFERELIAHYGREHLCNMTDGGEGVSGNAWSETRRANASAQRRGRKYSEEAKESQRVKKAPLALDAEWKRKTRDAKVKAMSAPDVRARMSAAAKARLAKGHPNAKPLKCIETGEIFADAGKAAQWLLANGIAKVHRSLITRAASGVLGRAHGYRWAHVK